MVLIKAIVFKVTPRILGSSCARREPSWFISSFLTGSWSGNLYPVAACCFYRLSSIMRSWCQFLILPWVICAYLSGSMVLSSVLCCCWPCTSYTAKKRYRPVIWSPGRFYFLLARLRLKRYASVWSAISFSVSMSVFLFPSINHLSISDLRNISFLPFL